MKLSTLVTALGGELSGDDREVCGVAPLDLAGPDQLSFFAHPKYRSAFHQTRAAAVIVSPKLVDRSLALPSSLIIVADPMLYWARVLTWLQPKCEVRAGIDPRAVVGRDTQIAASTEIRALACIGDRVRIGERCVVHAGVVIGDDVCIGDDAVLHPKVTLYAGCRIGDRVTLHSGAVIGADGFGLAWTGDRWLKVPQTGGVVIGNDVEIGANTTVDRGALSDTRIANGVQIDNQVQVAHNVSIGAHTAIAACTGIAGSTRIGERCRIGGAAILIGHLEVAADVQIGAGTLVTKSIQRAGDYASSFPFMTKKDWRENAVHLRHLDQIVGRVRQVESQLKQMSRAAPGADAEAGAGDRTTAAALPPSEAPAMDASDSASSDPIRSRADVEADDPQVVRRDAASGQIE
ncbi:UDP-3-O-(3-hydroxymyristoyl)glucosamine N-acyltransferase [Roseateles amylovorans]|uniref:UDP-3-O-acylglucosamine N-acyltransferase n=1 Tax=Roseateles amylovorans TaxID=2978473 RepID=A0ABY6ATT2_9BURK|nr:UDP-3-O-(3-hydroxymyristoyl)glucosamine N-acyltransferase [Roseateles amylovorans]UXH76631.1 UDP-3-O-(3-hydroxymyristoyl)glucosamine N-acyltransferase [Roseateles amylovorans]